VEHRFYTRATAEHEADGEMGYLTSISTLLAMFIGVIDLWKYFHGGTERWRLGFAVLFGCLAVAFLILRLTQDNALRYMLNTPEGRDLLGDGSKLAMALKHVENALDQARRAQETHNPEHVSDLVHRAKRTLANVKADARDLRSKQRAHLKKICDTTGLKMPKMMKDEDKKPIIEAENTTT